MSDTTVVKEAKSVLPKLWKVVLLRLQKQLDRAIINPHPYFSAFQFKILVMWVLFLISIIQNNLVHVTGTKVIIVDLYYNSIKELSCVHFISTFPMGS
jgi:hypothetical protein